MAVRVHPNAPYARAVWAAYLSSPAASVANVWLLAAEPFRQMCLQGIAPRARRSPWAALGAAELIRHDGPRHLAGVLDWLRHQASADDSLSIAGMLGSALPEGELGRLTEAGLSHSSPFIRWLAVGLLETQPPQAVARVRRIIKMALADEPEEELRLNLESLLGQ